MQQTKVLPVQKSFFSLVKLVYAILFLCIRMKSPAQTNPLNRAEINTIQNYEDTLSTLAYGVLHADLADERLVACHDMIPMLVKALKVPNSFQYRFPRLETVSIQYPADSTFRIFTWQLKIDEADYRYYGAIQWNQSQLKLAPLVDRSMSLDNIYYTSHTNDQWYGALYYNIKSFKMSTGETAYLLFGYDAYDVNDHRKIIDVLKINKDGKPVFGAPIFKIDKSTLKYRVTYEYSSDASIRVNYDDTEQMIVCDHLQQINGIQPGQGKTWVPDGSYEGWKLEKGVWKYVSNVFDSGDGKNQRALVTRKKEVKSDKEEK